MDLLDELVAVLDVLESHGVAYALCGGLAVAFYGYTRFTEDIDILIREEDVSMAKAVLAEVGFDLPAGPIPFDTGTPRARLLHRVSKVEGDDLLTLDLMLVTPVFAEVFEQREIFEWHGRQVQIVSAAGLAKMKRLAGRSKDLLDLEELGLDDDQET